MVFHLSPASILSLVVDANKDVKDMKLVFEKMAELFQAAKVNDLIKETSEDDNKENIQVKSSKRVSEVYEVPEKNMLEARKRTCIRNIE